MRGRDGAGHRISIRCLRSLRAGAGGWVGFGWFGGRGRGGGVVKDQRGGGEMLGVKGELAFIQKPEEIELGEGERLFPVVVAGAAAEILDLGGGERMDAVDTLQEGFAVHFVEGDAVGLGEGGFGGLLGGGGGGDAGDGQDGGCGAAGGFGLFGVHECREMGEGGGKMGEGEILEIEGGQGEAETELAGQIVGGEGVGEVIGGAAKLLLEFLDGAEGFLHFGGEIGGGDGVGELSGEVRVEGERGHGSLLSKRRRTTTPRRREGHEDARSERRG